MWMIARPCAAFVRTCLALTNRERLRPQRKSFCARSRLKKESSGFAPTVQCQLNVGSVDTRRSSGRRWSLDAVRFRDAGTFRHPSNAHAAANPGADQSYLARSFLRKREKRSAHRARGHPASPLSIRLLSASVRSAPATESHPPSSFRFQENRFARAKPP